MHGRPQEFFATGCSLPPPFPLYSVVCPSILLLPYPPAVSTLPFLLWCEADPLNPAMISWECCKLPQRDLVRPGQSQSKPVNHVLWQRFWLFFCKPKCCNSFSTGGQVPPSWPCLQAPMLWWTCQATAGFKWSCVSAVRVRSCRDYVTVVNTTEICQYGLN